MESARSARSYRWFRGQGSWKENLGVWLGKCDVAGLRDVQPGDDDHHCGSPSVLLVGFEEALVRDRDSLLGLGLFCQSGIQRSCGNGKSVTLTCVLQLILIAVANISTNKDLEIHR